MAIALLALALAVGGCSRPAPELVEGRFRAALVDSVRWRGTLDEKTLWRVEVRGDTAVDTIPGILTDRPVIVVPRAGVEGFAYDTAKGAIVNGFRYDPTKRNVEDIVIAEDVAGPFAAPALSPDGRHVAYLTVADGTARATVRIFPRGRIVATGPAIPIPPGDVAPGEAAWTSPDSFTVHVDAIPFRRVRFRGTVQAGVTQIDTVDVNRAP